MGKEDAKLTTAQERTLRHLWAGQSCALLLPTGGGKSMPFWIYAALQKRTIIVIEPTVALMSDQQQNLQAAIAKLPAAQQFRIASLGKLGGAQQDRAFRKGEYRLVFMSAEKLRHMGSSSISTMMDDGRIALVVVDEAHVLSTWGDRFRPDYKKLGCLRAYKEDVPLLALSGSITSPNLVDMEDTLGHTFCVIPAARGLCEAIPGVPALCRG